MGGEWREATFAELIEAGELDIGDGYRAKTAELGGDGPIFLRAGHVGDTHIDFKGVDRFREELASRLVPKMSQPGDIIVTTKGNSTGRVSFVSEEMPPFVYSPHLSYWRSLDVEKVVPGFLRYWSRGSEFQQQLHGLAASTDMAPYLSLRDQRRLRITLPPAPEQRAIAHILGTLDDKIELNRRMSETLEAMARALFKSWFVDFDPVRAKIEGRWRPGQSLPGLPAHLFDLFPDRLVESELGEIPEGWEVESLDEVADFVNGAACQKFAADSSTPTLPVVKIRELNQGISEATDRVREEFPEKHRANDGDVLFSWSGTLTCRVWTEGPAFVNQHVFRVSSDVYPRWFYLYWTKHHLERFKAIAAGKATTMGHIKRHHLSEAMTLLPSAELLSAMTENMETLVERQVNASLEAGRLACLRDELLPKLISGTLRVACEDPSVVEGD